MKENKEFSLEQSLGYKLSVASRLAINKVNRSFKNINIPITNEQWRILLFLSNHDGKTQIQLADQAGRDEASTSRILNNLIKEGYVKRVPHPDDHRKKLIFITNKGRNILPVVIEHAEKANEESIEGLTSEEIVLFNKILDRIIDNLSK